MDTERTPKVGDLVLFRLDSGNNPGEYRPAFIVRAWGATPEAVVNLQVLTDETNDGLTSTAWVTSRKHGDDNGQWLWPGEAIHGT